MKQLIFSWVLLLGTLGDGYAMEIDTGEQRINSIYDGRMISINRWKLFESRVFENFPYCLKVNEQKKKTQLTYYGIAFENKCEDLSFSISTDGGLGHEMLTPGQSVVIYEAQELGSHAIIFDILDDTQTDAYRMDIGLVQYTIEEKTKGIIDWGRAILFVIIPLFSLIYIVIKYFKYFKKK